MRIPVQIEWPTSPSAVPLLSSGQGWANAVRMLPGFAGSGTGYWHGKVTIGDTFTEDVAQLRIRLTSGSNATAPNNVVRLAIACSKAASGGASDGGLLEDFYNVTMPATAKTLVTQTCPLPLTANNGDTLYVRIGRLADDAADTFAQNVGIWDANLSEA